MHAAPDYYPLYTALPTFYSDYFVGVMGVWGGSAPPSQNFYMSGLPKDIYYDSLQNFLFSDWAETFFLEVFDL